MGWRRLTSWLRNLCRRNKGGLSENDVIDVIHRELHSKATLEKIVIDIAREIRFPNANPDLDEVRSFVEQMINECVGAAIQNRLNKIYKDITDELRQEIHEAIGRSQFEFINKWDTRLKTVENNLKKASNSHVAYPQPTQTADLTSIQNAIKQIKSEQQRIAVCMGQLEVKAKSSQPAAVPIGDNNLQAQIDANNKEIEALKRNFIAQVHYDKLKSAFDLLERENAVIKQQVSRQEQLLLNLEKQNAEIGRDLTDAKRQIESLQKQVASLLGNISASSVSVKPPAPSPSPEVSPWIKSFALIKPEKPTAFFYGNGDTAKANLAQSIRDMEGLITYLNQSKITEPARTSFVKNLRWCTEALEKLYKKFDFNDCDADELSEELTGKFFKIISENLLDNVMVAIYRGGKDAIGYEEFLRSVNRYLSKHGIYTEYISPGSKIEGKMLSSIEPPVVKQTSVAADDGKVAEVELLPYFMNYEDADGNLDTVRKRGRIVCLKYGA